MSQSIMSDNYLAVAGEVLLKLYCESLKCCISCCHRHDQHFTMSEHGLVPHGQVEGILKAIARQALSRLHSASRVASCPSSSLSLPVLAAGWALLVSRASLKL